MKKLTRQATRTLNLLVIVALIAGLIPPPALAAQPETNLPPPAAGEMSADRPDIPLSEAGASWSPPSALSPAGDLPHLSPVHYSPATGYFYPVAAVGVTGLGGNWGNFTFDNLSKAAGSPDDIGAHFYYNGSSIPYLIAAFDVDFGASLDGPSVTVQVRAKDSLGSSCRRFFDRSFNSSIRTSQDGVNWNIVAVTQVWAPNTDTYNWGASFAIPAGARPFRYVRVTWEPPWECGPSGSTASGDVDTIQIGGVTSVSWAMTPDRTYTPEDPCLANNSQGFAGHPVNTRTGNFTHQAVDVSIPTRGLSLTFERSYNSLDAGAGPLGPGWTHNYAMHLAFDGDVATLVAPRGSRLRFIDQGGGTFAAGPGVRATLTRNGDGSYTLTRGDQIVYTFDATGRLTTLADTNTLTGTGANTTTLTYSGDALTAIAAPDGRALTLTYDGQGRLIRLTDPLSRTVGYTYTNGYLTQISNFKSQITNYQYDAGRLRSITDPNNHTVTNSYDAGGRVISQTNALGQATTFTYGATQTVVTDPDGHATTHAYDPLGPLASVADALGHTTHYTYDPTSYNLTAVTDPLNRTTYYTWEASGCNVTSIADPLNGVTAMTYDARRNLLSLTDPLSRTTRFAYDTPSGRDNLTVITNTLGATATFTYDAYGQLLSGTDPDGHTTQYAYDAYGNLAVITNSLNYVTQMQYDLAGRLIQISNAKSQITSYEYDPGDNLLKVTDALNGETAYGYDKVGNTIAITDANHHTTTFGYDAADRLITATNALGARTVYGYDPAGNLARVTDATTRTATYQYDAANRLIAAVDPLSYTTRYGYDAVGNLTVITDANGISTRYGYDGLNRLTGVTDALGNVTAYGYDAVSNRTVITDANLHATHLTYDDLNRLENRSDPLNHTWHYDYDPAGNLVQISNPKSQITNYGYDALNRLTGIDYPASTPDVAFSYDPAGNRETMSDGTGTTTYGYDALNRPITVTLASGQVVYGYDAVGNRTRLVYPNSQVITTTYDAADRLIAVGGLPSAVSYAYDAAGRVVLSAVEGPSGVKSSFRYDKAGRLVCMDHRAPSNGPGQALAGYQYTLDAVGNRTRAVESQTPCISIYYFPIILKNASGGAMMSVPGGYNETFRSPLPAPADEAPAVATPVEEAPPGEVVETATPTEAPSPSATPPSGTDLPATPTITPLPTVPLTVTATLTPAGEPADLPLLPTETVTATETSASTTARAPGLAAPAPARAFNLSPTGVGDLLAWLWDGLSQLIAWLGENVFTPGPVARGDVALAAPLVFDSPIGGQGGGSSAVVITYTYDNLYRLTGAIYSSGESFAYAYDPAGNRQALTETVGLTQTVHSYAYDAADRLTSVDGVAYTWDDDGNLLGDGVRTYSYDAADRLTAVSGLPSAVGYTYNGDGLLAAQTVGGVPTTYVWDVAAPLPQVLATSNGAVYVHGLGLLAQQQGGAWQYPLPDGLGSIRQMVNPLGQVTQSYRFDPFGVPLGTSGGGPYGFAGEQWDAATGLLYLRARWYNPALGRFLTRDPFPGLAALPTTQHPYVYVGNNPVNLTDPGGRIAPILIAAGVGAAIGGVAGGAGYVLAHPGGRPEDYLQSGGFWQAAGIGAASGAVAGAVGFWVGGVAVGGGLGGAIAGGVLSGSTAGAAGQVTANLLTPCAHWYDNLAEAAVFGGLTGGIAGGAGYGTRQLLRMAAGGILRRLTTSANASLGQNPGLARTVLFPSEYAAGQANPAVARMQYGNAVERVVAREIRRSPILDSLFDYTGSHPGPDFLGKSLFAGMSFDITTNTPRSIAGHLGRPYDQGLILLLYTRPPGFTVFP